MKNPLVRIVFVFGFIILLPIISYTVYQLFTISESEQELDSLYKNQLETVLFSVNQYTEDIFSSWSSRVLSAIESNKKNALPDSALDDFFSDNSSVTQVFFLSDSLKPSLQVVNNTALPDSLKLQNADSLLLGAENRRTIRRLKNYFLSGYRKLEPIPISGNNALVVIQFYAQDRLPQYSVVAIAVTLDKFISSVLGQKIRELSGGNFYVDIKDAANNRIYYSNREQDSPEAGPGKEFWVLKGITISIGLRGGTSAQLIKNRLQQNLIIIAIINVLLLGGAIFMYINIRREIHLAKMKAGFVANVSHELRTPLALISMFAESLQSGRVRTEEKKAEYYSIIWQETARLSLLVNRILNFSRMEAGKKKYTFENHNLNEIIKEVVDKYRFHLEQKNFSVSFKEWHAPLIALLDADAIKEVAINLLDNAEKYSNEIKSISIEVFQKSDNVCFSIADKGIGISTQDQKRIFEEFYRAGSHEVHNTKGTGLGLSIVRQIIKAHKGSISVTSRSGEGATFTVSIPAANQASEGSASGA